MLVIWLDITQNTAACQQYSAQRASNCDQVVNFGDKFVPGVMILTL